MPWNCACSDQKTSELDCTQKNSDSKATVRELLKAEDELYGFERAQSDCLTCMKVVEPWHWFSGSHDAQSVVACYRMKWLSSTPNSVPSLLNKDCRAQPAQSRGSTGNGPSLRLRSWPHFSFNMVFQEHRLPIEPKPFLLQCAIWPPVACNVSLVLVFV